MRLYYNTQYRRSGRRCVGKSAVRDRWIPVWLAVDSLVFFFFSSRRRHTSSVSAFLLNRSSDLIRVRNIRALNGRFNTSITHAYSIVIGGIQGDVLATDNNTVGMGDAGIKSAIQGSNVPNPDEAVPSFVSEIGRASCREGVCCYV